MTLLRSTGPQGALIGPAVRFRGIVIALSCLLVVYGLFALQRAQYGVFPEFAPPQVGVQTEAPGLSPEQVELLVTRPIENGGQRTVGHPVAPVECDPGVVGGHAWQYEALLSSTIARVKPVIVGATLLILIGCAALPFFSTSFIPELKEGHYILHMSAAPGTSPDQSIALGNRVTHELQRIPEIRSVSQRAGRAQKSDDIWGTHYSELDIDLVPLGGEASEAVQGKIGKALSGFASANMSLKTFLTERVEETLTGTTAPVAVNIYGDNLDVLDKKAMQVAGILRALPGAGDVQLLAPPGLPQLGIRLRPADVERWGLTSVEVLDAVRTAYQGDVVGQTYEGDRVFNVIALLDQVSRDDPAGIGKLPVRTPGGVFVPLSQLADIVPSSSRQQVRHEGARRVQTVTANVADADMTGFVAAAKAQIAAKIALRAPMSPLPGPRRRWPMRAAICSLTR